MYELLQERKETMTAAEKSSMMDMLKLLSSKIETAKEEVRSSNTEIHSKNRFN